MHRRSFLIRAAAATACTSLRGLDQSTVAAQLTLAPHPFAPQMPLSFPGLSYEMAQLTDPKFFSPSNQDLVALFRLLSPQGILRIGGNTSEFCWFRANPSTPQPHLHTPAGRLDANWMPHRLFAITPQAIDNLAGFLRATGWRLIYGLNFGNSSPARAAQEAAYVARNVGPQLDFFQIGNEPDFYHDANNGTRPPNWDFPDYLKEWTAFAQAIVAQVPSARFGGPDVGASSNWITQFAAATPPALSRRLVAITGHYYAEGPPNDPSVTVARLLAGNSAIAPETRAIEILARAHGRIYRMTEGNSCYRGGKPGLSDAFASALWAADYMLQLASLGCAGVNLHGGSSAFLTAGLGDHTPGIQGLPAPPAIRSGFYSPIQSEPGRPIKAMPIFYGMLLASHFAGNTFLALQGSLPAINATAYAAQAPQGSKVAIFNKDPQAAIDLSLRLPATLNRATLWRLQAPTLDATQEVTLAGSQILPHAAWQPIAEPIPIKNGALGIHIPAASAALLFLT